MCDSWLKEYTNRDEAYWMARVQQLIKDNTVTAEGEAHGNTDEKWVHQLVDEVIKNFPPTDPPYDGNMRAAASLSAILGLWFAQVQFAKTQDPNRPTFLRQRGYEKLMHWIGSSIQNMMDHSATPTFFMGQKWQTPWDPEAKSGEFV